TLDEYRANEGPLKAMMRFVSNGAVVSVLVAFAIYGLGLWIWYAGDTMTAIVVVCLGYLLFRLHRKLLVKLAVRKFKTRPGFEEAAKLLRRDAMRLGETRLLTELNGYSREEISDH
ncbi:MAG: hypothetical protein ACPG4N_05045, partial [Gammaproteobacteria bacterium]